MYISLHRLIPRHSAYYLLSTFPFLSWLTWLSWLGHTPQLPDRPQEHHPSPHPSPLRQFPLPILTLSTKLAALTGTGDRNFQGAVDRST